MKIEFYYLKRTSRKSFINNLQERKPVVAVLPKCRVREAHRKPLEVRRPKCTLLRKDSSKIRIKKFVYSKRVFHPQMIQVPFVI